MGDRVKKLSIIIPVYNAEKWLPSCVDSIIAATDDTAEILLVNDGSKDGSLRAIRIAIPIVSLPSPSQIADLERRVIWALRKLQASMSRSSIATTM